jgi:hypothetical protein
MANENALFKMFGFELRRAGAKVSSDKKLQSIVAPQDQDGSGYVTAAGGHYGQYIDFDKEGDAKDNVQLIMKYRGVSMHPEVDAAIADISNEAITSSDNSSVVNGHDMFRSWYVDGRLFHHLVVDESQPKKGIQDIRLIDSTKIRKVKEVKKDIDPKSGAPLIKSVREFYIFQDKPGQQNSGVQLSVDSVSYVTSGLMDESRKKIVSYLHKALKPINQLRMMEDSLVIYRLARAPERRIFYVDVGNLPRGKAEQYMKDIMARYRNKLVYDATTGELKDDRKHMSMLEDFWMPRREGGRGTEVSTLAGGENLGNIEDIIYFQKKLFRSLNVPLQRLEQEAQFSLGRTTEITRDEIKFQKFIDRLRKRFSMLFLEILKKQLLLKGIITEEDWDNWYNDIVVDYQRDNHFVELKDMDIMRERLQTMDLVQQYVGEYYSKEWVSKNILKLDDEEIARMSKQMSQETPDDDEEQEDVPPKQQPQPEVGDNNE